MTYNHAEAFCLMTYREDRGTEEEVIWNSRDGVTPFVITLRSGKTATHVDWRNDRCVPDYQPPIGSRIFIDLTPERAREIATRNVDKWLASPKYRTELLDTYGTREAAIADQIASFTEHGPAPDLIVVGEGFKK